MQRLPLAHRQLVPLPAQLPAARRLSDTMSGHRRLPASRISDVSVATCMVSSNVLVTLQSSGCQTSVKSKLMAVSTARRPPQCFTTSAAPGAAATCSVGQTSLTHNKLLGLLDVRQGPEMHTSVVAHLECFWSSHFQRKLWREHTCCHQFPVLTFKAVVGAAPEALCILRNRTEPTSQT